MGTGVLVGCAVPKRKCGVWGTGKMYWRGSLGSGVHMRCTREAVWGVAEKQCGVWGTGRVYREAMWGLRYWQGVPARQCGVCGNIVVY